MTTKRKAVIYGCGLIGRSAYVYLKDKFEILFFVDKNADKIRSMCVDGDKLSVYEPKELLRHEGITVIVASKWYREILEALKNGGVNCDIELFTVGMEKASLSEQFIEEELDVRTIDLGKFLSRQSNIKCKELTFIPGGSGVLDYVFLKEIAQSFQCKEYLEIGTYIGESINILTEYCDRLYSVTAPRDAAYSMMNWCKAARLPDYSERLTYNEKIVHYYMDSKDFDFQKHADTVELYFVDGDHSYSGVYCDTKNIFAHKREDAIVIWHDFKIARNQYNLDVVKAVRDALGNDFENVYVTDNNMCGIYMPRSRKFEFKLHKRCYEENAPLYTYDISLNNCRIRK